MAENERNLEVDQVLARRQASPYETEYLVRWRGSDIDQASWEPADHLSPQSLQTVAERFDESPHSPTTFPTATRRSGLRQRSQRTTLKMSASQGSLATAAKMNHSGSLTAGTGTSSEKQTAHTTALLPSGGSRWALRRFSHDSTVSTASSAASEMAALTKTKRRKTDEPTTNVPSIPASASPTQAGWLGSGLSDTRGALRSAGNLSPPASLLLAVPTGSTSPKNPINIITDYGPIAAPLTPSPSVKSPRGSPRGAQQQQQQQTVPAMDSPRNKAANVKRRGSQSPLNEKKSAQSSRPQSPKPTAAARDQKQEAAQSSPLSRVRKKLSLDASSSPESSSSSSGKESRGRKRMSSPGSTSKTSPLTLQIVETQNILTIASISPRNTKTPVESTGKGKAAVNPKKVHLSESSSIKTKSRKRSHSSSSDKSQRSKSASAISSPSAMNTSQGSKTKTGAASKKSKVDIVKTYPSRIRQSRISLDSQPSPQRSSSLSPKPAESRAAPSLQSDVATNKDASPTLKATVKPLKVPGKNKELKKETKKVKPVLKIRLKPGAKLGVGVKKKKTVQKKLEDKPVEPPAKKKKKASSTNEKQDTPADSDKPQGLTKGKTKPTATPIDSVSGEKSEASTTKNKVKSTQKSIIKSTKSASQESSIAKRKNSALMINIARKLKTVAKKRVTLQAPLKTPKKRLAFHPPRSPRKSPRIILKDVIQLSKMEYEMAMTAARKSPSPVAKKTLLMKGGSSPDSAGDSSSKKEGSASLKKEGSSLKKEGSTSLKKDGSTSLKKEGSTSLKKEGSTSLKKEGSASLKKEGSASLKKEGSASLKKEGSSLKKEAKVTNPESKKPKTPETNSKTLQKKQSTKSNTKEFKETSPKPVQKKSKGKSSVTDNKPTKKKVKGEVTVKKLAVYKRPISPDTSDDDVLYSLNPDYDGDDSDSESSLPSPTSQHDGEVAGILNKGSSAFQALSPRKLLLKDSIKPKTKIVKPVPRQGSSPVSPAKAAAATVQESASYKTPPSSPLQTAKARTAADSQRPDIYTSDLPTVPVMPLIPTSPSAANYKTLLRNLPNSLQPSRNAKRSGKNSDSGEDEDVVERRVSVRNSESAFRYKEIIVKKCPGYTQIWLFTTSKTKNALNPKVLQELSQALHNAKFDDSRVVLLSGSGSVFCSGVDLNFLLSGDRRQSAQTMADAIRDFVNVMIAFPKPVVAAVNGPAIGLGASILPLCDIIYASDKASFFCPYARLGQTPECCSSFTFPQVMGMAMANDMLLGGRKLTAIEAYQIGLVSQVFWPTSMMQEVIPRVKHLSSQSIRSLEGSKLLIRSHQRGKMELTNESECRLLVDRWSSAECQRAMRTYLDDELDYMT